MGHAAPVCGLKENLVKRFEAAFFDQVVDCKGEIMLANVSLQGYAD